MTDAEARRLVAKAMDAYETALNLSMEVMRDRYPSESRDQDAFSISGLIYKGHEGIRRLRLRVERETEVTA